MFVAEEMVESEPQYAAQRAYFDAEFAGYERYELENWRVAYIQRLQAAGLFSSGPLVDVGVGGSGYTVIEAARVGVPAVGCDLSLAGLQKARRFAEAEGVADRTRWACCSAEHLPLAAASCSAALAIAVLEHVPDDRAALSELARVLRPGGRAWVTVPHALRHISPALRPANRRHDRRLGHLRRYDADGLAAIASEFGLDVVDVQFTGHPVKVVQLVAGRVSDRLWWWCEARDRRRAKERRGSMQLSMVFARA
ncbi:MAG TPA: class I SAM-dependent methyltransferase [Gaiellaceae bacterium]|nr:class I SAM-dependent methyltransferase [Gaiellaceae bacterium]HWJ43869.1 class I SAM-dependent methyltransferase [Gaiellaceae bacterium]